MTTAAFRKHQRHVAKRNAKVLVLYSTGILVRKIASRVRLTTNEVRNIVSRKGKSNRLVRWSVERKCQVVAEYLHGDPVQEICDRHNTNPKQVRRIAKEHNVQLRPVGRQG